MDSPIVIEWAAAARFTWARMPSDVQTGLTTLLHQLVHQYAQYYQQLVDKQKALSGSPILHIPERAMWVRFKMNYQEDEVGPILFIYEFEELTKNEAKLALEVLKQVPNRLNTPTNCRA